MTGAAFVVGRGLLVSSCRTVDHRRRTGRCSAAAVRSGRRDRRWSPASASRSRGDLQGKVMTEVQPMKMAAAEALYETEAARRVLAVHHRHPRRLRGDASPSRSPTCCPSSRPATLDGEVEGINDLRAAVRGDLRQDPGAAYYSPGDYTPVIPRHLLDVPAHDRARPGSPPPPPLLDPVGDPRGRTPAGSAAPSGWRWPCRSCRCWPTRSAGSSPRWDASRGRSSG